jgi:hypothetical protein
MITPTIGRKVWYRPNPLDSVARNSLTQPMDATIVYVWHDRCVNLVVHDHAGNTHLRPSTLLMQGDESYDPVQSYCEWMPFQQGQAKAQAPHQATEAVSG